MSRETGTCEGCGAVIIKGEDCPNYGFGEVHAGMPETLDAIYARLSQEHARDAELLAQVRKWTGAAERGLICDFEALDGIADLLHGRV